MSSHLSRIIQWFRPPRKMALTEDEWLAIVQQELEKRGIYGSSNVQSTKDRREPHIIYVWPPDGPTH